MPAYPTSGPGFGLGLRTAHYQDFLSAPQPVEWLEIITDNFLVDGGKPLAVLDTIRRDYPIAMHGVAMSIGSATGLDRAYLERVKQLARRVEPMWISDHLCWSGVPPTVLHDLYPMPYTEESARLLITHIRQAQDILERRLVVENVSSYVRFSSSTESEWAFLAHVLNEADCELLLDVNNVYVSSVNHGFCAEAYLNGLPSARVRQIHLAGHSRSGAHIIDTHDHPVAPEVWALYEQACQRFPQVATMIERDDHIPPLGELLTELDQARAIAANAGAALAPPASSAFRQPANWTPASSELTQVQHQLVDHILHPAPAGLPDDVDAAGSLPGAQGMLIYHRAYRERLIDVLADSYPKCERYLGTDLFRALSSLYIGRHPPQERNLGRYGARFDKILAESYPANHELSDLAQLEWALREVFDVADVGAWTVSEIEEEGVQACLAGSPILHPSARLLWARTNALAIWRAIDADDDVPEVALLDEPRALAVWRKGHQPHFKSVDAAQAQFIEALSQEGATIAAVAEDWSASGKLHDPALLGEWLAAWWSDELLRHDCRQLPRAQADKG